MEFFVLVLLVISIANCIAINNLKKENERLKKDNKIALQSIQFLRNKTMGTPTEEHQPSPLPKQVDPVLKRSFAEIGKAPEYIPPTPKKEKENFEKMFGKNIVGILAAALIFIGIIAFGALVFTVITDTIKVVMIFLASFAMSALGIFLVRKNDNAFTNSIMGTGIGAIFISIFVTHLYFGMISDLVAFGLIFVWTLCVYLLARKMKSKVLVYIAHIGCFISTIMAIGYGIATDELVKITVYQVASLTMLLILDYSETKSNDIFDEDGAILFFKIMTTASLVLNFALNQMIMHQFRTDASYSGTLCMVIASILLVINTLIYLVSQSRFYKNETFEMIISNIAYMGNVLFGFIALLANFLENRIDTSVVGNVSMLASLTIFALIFVLLKLATNNEKGDKICLEFLLITATFLTAVLDLRINTTDISLIYGLGIAALSCFLYYRLREYDVWWISLGITIFEAISIIDYWDYLAMPAILYSVLFLMVIGALIYFKDGKIFSFPFIYFAYINTHLLMCAASSFESLKLDAPLAGIFIMIINIAFYVVTYNIKDDSSKYKLSEILTYIGESIVLLGYSFYIAIEADGGFFSSHNNGGQMGLIVLSTLMFFFGMVKIAKLIQNKHPFLGVWYGIKVTWLTLFPISFLTDLLNEQFIFSIACMFIALLCIFFGFKFDIKSTRIYGLLLTLTSVIKIVIVDVWGQDSIIRVISLILGGVICFAISATYNYIEKKSIKTDNTDSEE